MNKSLQDKSKMPWAQVFRAVCAKVLSFGVDVVEADLPVGVPGRFEKAKIVTNPVVDLASRCHITAHCLGHIVQWSLHRPSIVALYDELTAARQGYGTAPQRLKEVLVRFQQYEEEASEYGIGLYDDFPWAAIDFSIFARADITSNIAYLGFESVLPWETFYEQWKADVFSGKIKVQPFKAKPIPDFVPSEIPEIDVVQTIE